MARYSLFVLKVLLYTNQPTYLPLNFVRLKSSGWHYCHLHHLLMRKNSKSLAFWYRLIQIVLKYRSLNKSCCYLWLTCRNPCFLRREGRNREFCRNRWRYIC